MACCNMHLGGRQLRFGEARIISGRGASAALIVALMSRCNIAAITYKQFLPSDSHQVERQMVLALAEIAD